MKCAKKNQFRKKSFSLALAVVLAATWGIALRSARADEAYTFVIQKQEQKKSKGWNLAEWLDTRDRMRMMDLWLALNSPSPYEFYLGGDYLFHSSPGLSGNGFHFDAGAFASIFGLEGMYESRMNPDHFLWKGGVAFRFFGLNDQGTNITATAGVLGRHEGGVGSRSLYAGGRLTFYFSTFLGIDAHFAHIFPGTPGLGGAFLQANNLEGGLFLDFSFVRVYARYLYEMISINAGPMVPTSGGRLGVRFYF